MKIYFLFLSLVFLSETVFADRDGLVRRFAVFPVSVDQDLKSAGEKAWWKIREELTKKQRFTVASRRFMQKKSVFKEKTEISPADVIVLAKILDAHAVVSGFVAADALKMRVYNGKDGTLIWASEIQLRGGRALGPQIVNNSAQLVRAFVADIPFHGFQVRGNSIGPVVETEGDVRVARIDVGKAPGVQAGDLVQWVKMKRIAFKPLYQGGVELEIHAEGQVLAVAGNTATVELKKFVDMDLLLEQSIVYLPKEAQRLKSLYSLKNAPVDQLIRESGHLSEASGVKEEKSSLAFLLEFLGSMALVLVVAL